MRRLRHHRARAVTDLVCFPGCASISPGSGWCRARMYGGGAARRKPWWERRVPSSCRVSARRDPLRCLWTSPQRVGNGRLVPCASPAPSAASQPVTDSLPFSTCPISRRRKDVSSAAVRARSYQPCASAAECGDGADAAGLHLHRARHAVRIRQWPEGEGEVGAAVVGDGQMELLPPGVDPRADPDGRGGALPRPGELPPEAVRPGHREAVPAVPDGTSHSPLPRTSRCCGAPNSFAYG